jgi:hypothetical protein
MEGSSMLKKRFAIGAVSAAIVAAMITGSTIVAGASERPAGEPVAVESPPAAPTGPVEDTGDDLSTMGWLDDAKAACRDWSYAMWRMTDNGFVWGFMVGGATVGTAWYASHTRGKYKAFTARKSTAKMTVGAATVQMNSNLRLEIPEGVRTVIINNNINSGNVINSNNRANHIEVWSGDKHLGHVGGDCS